MTETTTTTEIDPTGTSGRGRRTGRGGRPLAFVAGAVFMCGLSAGLGATAATIITSADIKDGTIRGVDVRNGGLTGADVKDGTVTAGDVRNGSLTGADVKDATIGANDLAPGVQTAFMTGFIPPGTTVTGTAYFDSTSDVAGDFGIMVTLPARAHAPLTNALVNFRTDGLAAFSNDDIAADDGCTGSANAPMAPAGQVCIYLVQSATDSVNMKGDAAFGKATDQGFAIRWNDSASFDDVYLTAVWAYTAP